MIAAAAVVLSAGAAPAADLLPRLKVSDNRRFLVTADGKPFFHPADAAWRLFHRLTREEAERYLRGRAAKGFPVIQAVALSELDGLRSPNAYATATPPSSTTTRSSRTGGTSATSTGWWTSLPGRGCTRPCCPPGGTSGTRAGGPARRCSPPGTRPGTASESAGGTRTGRSSGCWAVVGQDHDHAHPPAGAGRLAHPGQRVRLEPVLFNTLPQTGLDGGQVVRRVCLRPAVAGYRRPPVLRFFFRSAVTRRAWSSTRWGVRASGGTPSRSFKNTCRQMR